MTFTYDLSTDIGKLRMRIPDKISDNYKFEDEELQAYLDINSGNIDYALVQVYETLCSEYNGDGSSDRVKIGDVEIEGGKSVSQNYCKLAKDLKESIMNGTNSGSFSPMFYCGGIFVADREDNYEAQCDGEIIPSIFKENTFTIDKLKIDYDDCDCE